MFSWSFICSFNMFRVFTSRTRSSAMTRLEVGRNLIKRCVVSFLMPVLVVLAVVVTTLLLTEGEKIGYGEKLCYLDKPLIVGLAVLGPMTLVVGSNVVFFTLTVLNIESIRHLQHHVTSSDTRNLLVYVKLSSLTGAFWTMAVVAEVTDMDFLRFVSICLNGLQGVFIFLSFICNKKIITLYAMAFAKSTRESTEYTDPRCWD
ncbi:unnamed protein product [Lymnaea stagnalis]|uniref:G-protein coupled receptors family 2 profile 2 domain-containing protein n=1 Tax=Lymnaea stagnalis TaxID=6523 RepID=A0AAV2HNT1_LYMST